jgi:hypothetical protein
VAEIWQDYRRDLGDKPTAKTMLYTDALQDAAEILNLSELREGRSQVQ